MASRPLHPSTYAHRYDLDGEVYALYHALTLDVVYVGAELGSLFRPVGDRPRPFPEPAGGTGDVPPVVPWQPVDIDAWCAAADIPACRRQREEAIDRLVGMHLLRRPDDPFDVDELVRLQAMTRDNPIRMLTLVPTTVCNFRCSYCHQLAGEGVAAATMTVPQVRRVMDWWGRYARRREGPKDLLLYGGEPLLAPDAVKWVIEHLATTDEDAYRGQVEVILVTNGSHVDREWARFLAQHDTFVIVSCDGVGEDNDRARHSRKGDGTWDAVCRCVDRLHAEGVRTAVSVTVGSHNLDNLEQSFAGVIERLRPMDIGLNSCLHPPFGQARNEWACPPLDATRRMLEAYSAARARGVYVEQFNRRVRPFAMRTHRLKECPACGGRLVAQPDGTVSFCDSFSFTPDFSYPLEEFDLDSNPDYPRWAALSPVNWPACGDCPAIALCGGGCRYDAMAASGRLDGLDPDRCTQDREVLRWVLSDLGRRVGAERLSAVATRVPTEQERESVLGPLNIDPMTIPLGNANRFGERVGRPGAR